MTAHLWRRFWNAIGFGSLSTVNDGGPVQTAQVRLGYSMIRDGVPVVQLFGLSGNPPVPADAVVLFLGGDPSNGVAIATNHQGSRPKNQAPGETTLYNAFGMSIYLSKDGITLTAPKFTVDAAQIILNGNVTQNGPGGSGAGNFTATGEITRGYGGSDQVSLGGHKHPQGNDSHGDTEPDTGAPIAGT